MNNQLSKPYEVRHFQFVIVGLEELEPEETCTLMGNIEESFRRLGGYTSTYSPFIIIGSFGSYFSEDSVESRFRVVNELLANHHDKVRIAHGQADGIVGHIGSEYRSSYGPLIPGFQEIREKLSETPFGMAFEVS